MATEGSASGGSLPALEGTVFDARFRVEERIAEGGFAVVYKAWQLALERRVALKVLKSPRNQDAVARAEFRARFAAEARTIATLRHPDIVDVYDFSVATLPSGELAPWMALEWLDGETLARHLGRRRRAGKRGRDPHEAVDFLRPVMQALAHAHQHGVVHRDIKPSNVMVAETPQGPSLRVLDFGIAKVMVDSGAPNTGNTRTESVPAFSPAYAAPEQVSFSRTGPWTDVHALGLILAEVMTDEAPFSDPDPEAHLFEQVMARRRPTPSSKGRDVGLFEPILAKALALSPRDRWRNASELLAALEEAMAGRATDLVDTAPPNVVERAGQPRPPRTGRGRRATGGLVLAAAVASAAWGLTARKQSPGPRSERTTLESAATPDRRSLAPIVEPDPETAPAVASSAGLPPRRTGATSPPAPSGARLYVQNGQTAKDRKRVSVAPGPVKVEDGRDVFNDTK